MFFKSLIDSRIEWGIISLSRERELTLYNLIHHCHIPINLICQNPNSISYDLFQGITDSSNISVFQWNLQIICRQICNHMKYRVGKAATPIIRDGCGNSSARRIAHFALWNNVSGNVEKKQGLLCCHNTGGFFSYKYKYWSTENFKQFMFF